MPDIVVGAQIFDLVFHPTHSTVYTALLTGHVKAFAYGPTALQNTFSVRPSKRSCRALAIDDDGAWLYAAGKGKAIHTIDTTTGNIVETRAGAHDDPINRTKHLMPWLFASGDDSGVIKLWDPRQQAAIRTHRQHFDYISDFLWLPDKHHLLATSGDGTLSVMDVRSKKTVPFAHSEDQEDELLSATTIKSGAKVVVGTQLGILSVFNRSSGYGDCVDRVPGHPSSIDALCSLPPAFSALVASQGMENTVLTGSSDGLVRAVQVLPTRLVGVVADHGELPIERLAVGGGQGALAFDEGNVQSGSESGDAQRVGQRKGKERQGAQSDDQDEEEEDEGKGNCRWWVGSAGHDEVLRLTDLEAFFRDPGAVEKEGEDRDDDASEAEDDDGEVDSEAEEEAEAKKKSDGSDDEDAEESDTAPAPQKRKRKQKDLLVPVVRRKKGRNELDVEGAFFDGLE